MAGRSVAVQAFKVELRAAGIVQFRRIGMGSQRGPVCRDIVRHKLAKDRPTSRAISERTARIIDFPAIAKTTGSAERAKELLIRPKRWQLGKHPIIGCWANRCIDRYSGSRPCRTMTHSRWSASIYFGTPFRHPLVQIRFRHSVALLADQCWVRGKTSVAPSRGREAGPGR